MIKKNGEGGKERSEKTRKGEEGHLENDSSIRLDRRGKGEIKRGEGTE